jgi:hypothetical protein
MTAANALLQSVVCAAASVCRIVGCAVQLFMYAIFVCPSNAALQNLVPNQ